MTTQNTISSKPQTTLKDQFETLGKLEKKLLIAKTQKFFNISRAQAYQHINGNVQLTHESALFFSKYFGIDPIELVPSNRIELIGKLTQIKAESSMYGDEFPALTVSELSS